MIVGLLLRNYKTYQNINYIPLSNGSMFSAIVGENGSGKSSVLEALDSFFNAAEWNLNHSLTKGYPEREPYICPIFLIKKGSIDLEYDEYEDFIEKISKMAWVATPQDFNSSPKPVNEFCSNRDILLGEGYGALTHYLLPLGLMKVTAGASPVSYFSIFESLEGFGALQEELDWSGFAESLFYCIYTTYQYIYIPSEINFKEYTKIESKTVQALLGTKIEEIVRNIVKKATVTDINQKLNAFLAEISNTLENYEYKKPAKKQNLFNQSHLTEKIIEAFFDSKILTKTVGKDSVPVNNLSSGEKRQALIDIARAFLLETEPTREHNVIFAIDEPELSLHVSACFEQFEKLKDISQARVQTIVTTHWYGFMPIVSDGVAIYCPKLENELIMIDLRCFREDIAKLRRTTQGKLPSDLELKGLNDLVQSMIASITGKDYKWIVCEGSADKIYLDFYLSRKKLFILPVGGSKHVKKIFKYLEMALEDNRDDIKGRVFLLLDTEKAFEKYDANDSIKQIQIKRIHNDIAEGQTLLKSTSNTEYHPPTVIEDTLIPNDFLIALKSFEDDPDFGAYVSPLLLAINHDHDDWPAALAFDLRATEQRSMDELFSLPSFKVKFALKYTQVADILKAPPWMITLNEFLFPVAKKPRSAKQKI
ncbi:AAA family ATPase [Pseudomonas veronii]|uniref:AAA family ATPase n=1 Tax=Pseudomonas veronii TaxID=76761 RepID=UPI000A766B41|nr:AAA family ATPase [Pseudomonas veronii]